VFGTIGGLFALLAVAVLAGGVWLALLYGTHRGDDGFVTSSVAELSTDGHALISSEIQLAGIRDEWLPSGELATLELRAASAVPLFLGVGPSDDVDEYLRDVSHSRVSDFGGSTITYVVAEGTEEPLPPGTQAFWLETSEGAGPQRLTWDLGDGDWAMVIMNADASPGVDAEASIAVKTDWLVVAIVALILLGVLFSGLAALFAVLAFKREPAPPAPEEPKASVVLAGPEGGD